MNEAYYNPFLWGRWVVQSFIHMFFPPKPVVSNAMLLTAEKEKIQVELWAAVERRIHWTHTEKMLIERYEYVQAELNKENNKVKEYKYEPGP